MVTCLCGTELMRVRFPLVSKNIQHSIKYFVGLVAPMVERLIRIQEVEGSTPFWSKVLIINY